jgi:hypothetical protein
MRKGVIFFSVILALLFLLIFMPLAINSVTVKEAKFKEKLGDSQLQLLSTYDKGEKALFFIDIAGKNALYESFDELETTCGEFNGYAMLNSKDKNCMAELGKKIEENSNKYFSKFTEEIPYMEYEFSFGESSLVMKSKNFLRMEIGEKYNFIKSPKLNEDATTIIVKEEPEPQPPDNQPITPVDGSGQNSICSYCNAGGWDTWLPTVNQWDSSQTFVVSGSKTCFRAKCPPNTKILEVPYTNQCQIPYGSQPNAWPSTYGYGNLDACMAMCGPTALQMVTDYYGGSYNVQAEWWMVKATRDEMVRRNKFDDYYGNAARSYMAQLPVEKTGKQLFYVDSANINTIKSYIDQGRPVITGLLLGKTGCPQISPFTYYCYHGMGHIFVVVGYGNGYIILNDPYTSYGVGYDTIFGNNLVLPESGVQGSFMSIWSGALVV